MSSSAHTKTHAAVVYQPLKTNLTAFRTAVSRAEDHAGWAATRWYETEAHDAGVSATMQALNDGASVVLASGGDGTIRAVAEALRGAGVPLTVVPQGTGNLLARNLGVPLHDLSQVARAAFQGENRAIDLGVVRIHREDPAEVDANTRTDSRTDNVVHGPPVDEHVFLVLAGMGIDARAVSATRSTLKKRLGWLAYVDAGMRSMLKDKPLHIHYSLDGSEVKPLSVYTVMIGNCGLLPGGVLLIPDAEVDDGLLDVVALRPLGPFSWLRIWNKIGWENGVLRKSKTGRRIIDLAHDTKHVTYVQAKNYALSVAKPEHVQLDGDDFGLAVAVSGTVDPGALLVRVLPHWESRVQYRRPLEP